MVLDGQLLMGLYSRMFWGVSQLLPQQTAGDASERASVFFAVAWVGHLMLADVGLFGGHVTRQALGGGGLTVGLLIAVGLLYGAHVVYARRRTGDRDAPMVDANSGRGSVVGGIAGILFVLMGWASLLGMAVLTRQ